MTAKLSFFYSAARQKKGSNQDSVVRSGFFGRFNFFFFFLESTTGHIPVPAMIRYEGGVDL